MVLPIKDTSILFDKESKNLKKFEKASKIYNELKKRNKLCFDYNNKAILESEGFYNVDKI
jgi:hypothetical protein